MAALPPILAEFDDSVMKVVIGVIIAVIWGVGALANLAKKQQQEQGQSSQAEMERALRARLEAARRDQAARALGQMSAPPMPTQGLPPGSQYPQYRPQQQGLRGPSVPPMRPRAPQQQAQRRPAPRGLPPAVPPPMRPPGAQQQTQRPHGPVMAAKRTRKAERHQPAAPPALAEADSYSQGPPRPGVLESEIGVGTAPASPARRLAAAAPMVRVTPQSLRQQFILTELLQPPLTLREPREP